MNTLESQDRTALNRAALSEHTIGFIRRWAPEDIYDKEHFEGELHYLLQLFHSVSSATYMKSMERLLHAAFSSAPLPPVTFGEKTK